MHHAVRLFHCAPPARQLGPGSRSPEAFYWSGTRTPPCGPWDGLVGSLSDVIAPPYDVIDEKLQGQLDQAHPANTVRLILNRSEPGDVSGDERYQRAAQFFRNWRREGVLQSDAQACIYVYQQSFTWEDQTYHRLGFMARVRLEPVGTGSIYPHEETHAAAKADRLKLTTACKAHLSPIFGVFPDDQTEARAWMEHAIAALTPVEATDHLGVGHRMWMVQDVKAIAEQAALRAHRPTFVADGHHRYETACNYRELLAAEGPLPDSHPANFVLMMCVGMSDPGMIVLPTHRLFRGLPPLTQPELQERLAPYFDLQMAGIGAERATELWEEIVTADQQSTLALHTAADDQWTLARLNEHGQAKMAEISPDHGADWQGLGVSLLQRLVLEHALGGRDRPKPMYVHSVQEVIDGIRQGDTVGRDATGQQGQGGKFPLTALVMPASLDHVRAISQQGERMPAKSTYFYPKLLSGLVFNPLE